MVLKKVNYLSIVLSFAAIFSAEVALANEANVMMTYSDLKSTNPKVVSAPTKAKDLLLPVSLTRGRFLVVPLAPPSNEPGKGFKVGVTVSIAIGG